MVRPMKLVSNHIGKRNTIEKLSLVKKRCKKKDLLDVTYILYSRENRAHNGVSIYKKGKHHVKTQIRQK